METQLGMIRYQHDSSDEVHEKPLVHPVDAAGMMSADLHVGDGFENDWPFSTLRMVHCQAITRVNT